MEWLIALLVAFAPAPVAAGSGCRLKTIPTKRLDLRTGTMTDSFVQQTVCDDSVFNYPDWPPGVPRPGRR